MKRILSAHRSWFMALGLAVAVSGMTRWLPDHDGRRGDYGLAEAPPERGGPGRDAAAERPARRLRASSTMPYFSFAQSLRSRG